MDTKPLLQDRPPAYNTVPAAYDYGSVPAAGFQAPAPPPYQGFPAASSGFPAAPGPATSQPAYTNTYTIVQPSVVVVGGCPACRVGVLEEDFTCLGIMCAIFFFPLGILFCLALRQRRCPNCGATFG
ncbi:brain protein I3-like isoform X2 [Carassius auratus]|uniref:Membrane protein BRI3 n=1 Tax=Carassius auratus TaxID=7957 RepID=A0A6P6KK49_CARAU|nr:brain protein I3-like isoform X2 [Carassius auratus]XP_052392128.1 brain protein I3 isoform X2 [Carassius gibelio]